MNEVAVARAEAGRARLVADRLLRARTDGAHHAVDRPRAADGGLRGRHLGVELRKRRHPVLGGDEHDLVAAGLELLQQIGGSVGW